MGKKAVIGWSITGVIILAIGGVAATLTLGGVAASTIFDGTQRNHNVSGTDKMTVLEKVTDDLGAYTRTYVDVPADFKMEDGTTLSPDALAAFTAAWRFVSGEGLDSIALDNPSRWEEWKANVAPLYITQSTLSENVDSNQSDNSQPSTIIFRPSEAEMPRLVRDGGVRIADKRLAPGVKVTYNKDDSTYLVHFDGSALVYFTDKSAEAWYPKNQEIVSKIGTFYNADGTPFTAEQQAAHLQDIIKNWRDTIQPEFKDNLLNSFLVTFTSDMWMVNEGGKWMISRADNVFTYTGQGLSGNLAYQNARNNLITK